MELLAILVGTHHDELVNKNCRHAVIATDFATVFPFKCEKIVEKHLQNTSKRCVLFSKPIYAFSGVNG